MFKAKLEFLFSDCGQGSVNSGMGVKKVRGVKKGILEAPMVPYAISCVICAQWS